MLAHNISPGYFQLKKTKKVRCTFGSSGPSIAQMPSEFDVFGKAQTS